MNKTDIREALEAMDNELQDWHLAIIRKTLKAALRTPKKPKAPRTDKKPQTVKQRIQTLIHQANAIDSALGEIQEETEGTASEAMQNALNSARQCLCNATDEMETAKKRTN